VLLINRAYDFINFNRLKDFLSTTVLFLHCTIWGCGYYIFIFPLLSELGPETKLKRKLKSPVIYLLCPINFQDFFVFYIGLMNPDNPKIKFVKHRFRTHVKQRNVWRQISGISHPVVCGADRRWCCWWSRQYASLKYRSASTKYTALYPTKLSPSYSPPWEHEIPQSNVSFGYCPKL
jgi:hypothetical protein